ncbi:MAG: hypothetical protein WDM89_03680 [Rhizomicrobium sp.]
MSKPIFLALLTASALCCGAAGSVASDMNDDGGYQVVNVSVHDGSKSKPPHGPCA